jgi:hypothetical protein
MTAKAKQKAEPKELHMKEADFDAIMRGALQVAPEPPKQEVAKPRKRRVRK